MRVVELFAGVGGFRVGLENVSKDFYRTVWANQWEPGSDRKQFAFKCYDVHFADSGSINVNADIEKVWQDIPEHDLLVGGFPCQDYSVASTGAMGIEGKKGVLWWSINKIISSEKRPRYIMLENVDRLLRSPSKQRGRDFAIILRCLADQGYYVEWRMLNAADYGMPQKRRRIFIFACLDNQPFVKKMSETPYEMILSKDGFFARAFGMSSDSDPMKTVRFDIGPNRYRDVKSVSDEFSGRFFRSGIMLDGVVYTREYVPVFDGHFETLREKLESEVNDEFFITPEEQAKMKYAKGSKRLVRTTSNGISYNYSEGSIPFPDELDTASRTMLTSEGTLNRSSHVICDPKTKNLRTLTPLECERLNGFPDGWTADVMTKRQRYFCMGNSLVVPIVTQMGHTLKTIEEGSNDDRSYRSRNT